MRERTKFFVLLLLLALSLGLLWYLQQNVQNVMLG